MVLILLVRPLAFCCKLDCEFVVGKSKVVGGLGGVPFWPLFATNTDFDLFSFLGELLSDCNLDRLPLVGE